MVHYLTMSEGALNAEELAMSKRASEHRRAQACVPNRKLKLPPILPSGQYVQDRSSLQQQEEFTDITNSINLPRLDLCSLGLRSSILHDNHNGSKRHSQKTDFPSFSIPRVYDVLPPIGKTKLIPSAPRLEDVSGKPKADSTNKRRRPRQYRTKKPSTNQGDCTVSEQKSTVNIEMHAEGTFNHLDELPQDNSTFAIQISDPCTPNELETVVPTIIQDQDKDEDKRSQYVGFYNFSAVPRAFQAYTDLYPPSPPPTDRKARNIVEKKRQELKDENKYRQHFMRNHGYYRRNATCTELDDNLKNATELLREMFLRKTMEELCMLW